MDVLEARAEDVCRRIKTIVLDARPNRRKAIDQLINEALPYGNPPDREFISVMIVLAVLLLENSELLSQIPAASPAEGA